MTDQRSVIEAVEGKIFYNGIDVTWNDRFLADLFRDWAHDEWKNQPRHPLPEQGN